MTIKTQQTFEDFATCADEHSEWSTNAIEDYQGKGADINEIIGLVNNGDLSSLSGSGNPEGVVTANYSLFYVDTNVSALYFNEEFEADTGWTLLSSGGGGAATWGTITGTLSDQTDLQAALDLKADLSSLATVATTGLYSDLTGQPTLVSAFTNDANYIVNISAFSTSDLSEGTNLYYTESRVAANSAVALNTAKISNVTHTGDVTGATALTIAVGAVDIAMLSASGTPDSTTFLRGDNTWAVPGGGGSVAWGAITGTLSDQTDLQAALDLKAVIAADNEFSASQSIDRVGDSASAAFNFNVDDAFGSHVIYKTGGLNRWAVGKTAIAESGSDVGSDFQIVRYDDAGAAVTERPLIINRASGVATFAEPITAPNVGIYSFNRLIGATTQAVTSTLTAITWDSSDDSSGSDVTFSGANPTRLTAVSAGVYKIGGYVTIQSTGARAQTAIEIMINGTPTGLQRSGTYLRNSGASYDYWAMELSSTPFTLSASDYVELGVGQVTGATYGYAGALTITCERTRSEFCLERVA